MSSAIPLWLADQPLVLASGSTTRRDMLRAAGIPVEVITPIVDERAIEAPLLEQGVPAEAIAAALACAKALAVSALHPDRMVLGADQILTCDGESFHKPQDAAGARAQIKALAGRSHELHAAFVLAHAGGPIAEECRTVRMTMRDVSPGFVAAYVAEMGEAALSSVGAYQIEGLGAQLFDEIEGDHFAILGLPLLAVLAALREHGLLAR